MAWNAGQTVTSGDIATAAYINQFTGAGGSLDFLSDGVKILNSQVYAASIKTTSAVVDNAKLIGDSGATGGLEWLGAWEEPDFWLGR